VFFLALPLFIAPLFFIKGERNILFFIIGLILYYLLLKVVWKIFVYIVFGNLEKEVESKNVKTIQQVATEEPKASGIVPLIILFILLIVAALLQNGHIKLPEINIPLSHEYGTPCKSTEEEGIYGTDGSCYTCPKNSVAVTSPIGNNCSKDPKAGVYCCIISDNNDNNNSDNGSNTDECIPTGCGSLWYCSGSYYIGEMEIEVPGLCFPTPLGEIYPTWKGTCRQCP